MQSLDIISVNLWHILISLANLVLMFFIVKKFLFKPVKKLFDERKEAIDKQYAAADEAKEQADAAKAEWEEKLSGADAEADRIVKNAVDTADYRAAQIVADANAKAGDIVRRAENEAALTVKRAEDGIKHEIVEVSSVLAEKMLEREINADDHRAMIDSFIENMGEDK